MRGARWIAKGRFVRNGRAILVYTERNSAFLGPWGLTFAASLLHQRELHEHVSLVDMPQDGRHVGAASNPTQYFTGFLLGSVPQNVEQLLVRRDLLLNLAISTLQRLRACFAVGRIVGAVRFSKAAGAADRSLGRALQRKQSVVIQHAASYSTLDFLRLHGSQLAVALGPRGVTDGTCNAGDKVAGEAAAGRRLGNRLSES